MQAAIPAIHEREAVSRSRTAVGATTQQPLTAPGWRGLPIVAVMHAEAVRYVGHHLPSPLLVFWQTGGTEVDVVRVAGRRAHFQAEGGRFDMWDAGEYPLIVANGVCSRKLLVELTPEATERCAGAADERRPLGRRFQFADPVLRRLLQRLVQQAAAAEPLGSLYTESLSAAVLYRLTLTMDGAAKPGSPAALTTAARRRFVELIENGLGAPPSLADLALAAGLRTADFLKAFRASFGASPHQYVLARRIERAKHLLRQGWPPTSVALELGFASHGHFSATFRKHTGVTPSEYRGHRHVAVPEPGRHEVSTPCHCT